MNEKFVNGSLSIEISDKGLTCISETENLHYFFPYGSIDVISIKLFGVSIIGGKASFLYTFGGDDKKRFKRILPTVENLNRCAERTAPITTISNSNLEKNWESFKKYFSFMAGKHEHEWHGAIETMIGSMSSSEEIVYGFFGNIMYINGQSETVCNYVAVITNERFYFAGTEGSAVLFHLKTGSVELKDVHAITVGANSALAAKYVQFEVKNDNYRATTFTDVNVIKDVLDKVVKECASKNNTANVVQAAFSSADELKKFKELLDLGIITQEEFDAKKKQLLGL